MSDSDKGGGMASRLAEQLRQEAERAGGIRSLARAIGLSSDSILHRVFSGGAIEHKTVVAIAKYLHVSATEVYQMHDMLPPSEYPPDEEIDPEQARWLNTLYGIFMELAPVQQSRFLEIAVWFPQLSDENQGKVIDLINELRKSQTHSQP